MNKLSKYGTTTSPKQFQRLIRYIFDDPETVEEEYDDRSCCFVKQIGVVKNLVEANDALTYAGINSIPMEGIIGTWMMEGSRCSSNGFYWDEVSEVYKVEKTTETIIVETWKPICDENVLKCSPKQPQSKVCLPE